MTINVNKLKELIAATASPAGYGFVSADDGKPMQMHVPPLIVINLDVTNPNNPGEIAAKVTDAAAQYVASMASGGSTAPAGEHSSKGVLVAGFVAPAPKRRGRTTPEGGSTSKYPFDQLGLEASNCSFFVGNSEVDKGNAFKTLGATVSSANRRNSVETGEVVKVERAKRGDDKKPVVGTDGKKVMETVEQKKRKAVKHFRIVPVENGVTYGSWTAPESGAMIIRDL